MLQDRLFSGSHNTIHVWETSGDFAQQDKIEHSFGSVYSLAITKQFIIAGRLFKIMPDSRGKMSWHFVLFAAGVCVFACVCEVAIEFRVLCAVVDVNNY